MLYVVLCRLQRFAKNVSLLGFLALFASLFMKPATDTQDPWLYYPLVVFFLTFWCLVSWVVLSGLVGLTKPPQNKELSRLKIDPNTW